MGHLSSMIPYNRSNRKHLKQSKLRRLRPIQENLSEAHESICAKGHIPKAKSDKQPTIGPFLALELYHFGALALICK